MGRPKYFISAILLVLNVSGCTGCHGRIANPGFENNRIKTTLFFAGQARDGSAPYKGTTDVSGKGCFVRSNLWAYTVKPTHTAHLRWSESDSNRHFALQKMIEAGVNVVTMSSWGESFLPCDLGWARSAPMQTAPKAQDELFEAAVKKELLIMPLIESRKDWNFFGEFPEWTDPKSGKTTTAPGTISQIVDLINRYVKNQSHPEWGERWARVYNRKGEARYAISIIHVASNPLDPNDPLAHSKFAQGFDDIALRVAEKTNGVKVGFFLDVLSPDTNAPGRFKATPEHTGPELRSRDSILGIQNFKPEIWLGIDDIEQLIKWKRNYSERWWQTRIPFLMDVSPGYDNRKIFPKNVLVYGFDASWKNAQSEMVRDFGQNGLVYNAWNGYTEGLVAVPMQRVYDHPECCGATFYDWFKNLNR